MHKQLLKLGQHTLYLSLVNIIPSTILVAELCREQNEQPSEMFLLRQVL